MSKKSIQNIKNHITFSYHIKKQLRIDKTIKKIYQKIKKSLTK